MKFKFTAMLFVALILLTFSGNAQQIPFKGDIKLDVRDSKADWAPYIRKKAPEGSPNILFILYDDTGLGCMVSLWWKNQYANHG